MTEKEKSIQGLLYDPHYGTELSQERIKCKDLCYKFNQLQPSNQIEQTRIIKEIFGKIGKSFFITQPFWCDYGYNIEIGNNFYTNHNCVILDEVKVSFGNNVFVAPNCCFSTAGHPIDVTQRNLGLEFAYPIIVGNNVWIGANTTVLPGVTIGDNSIIGAGSVVTKNIPSNVIAVGNPCRILRNITDKDREKYKSKN